MKFEMEITFPGGRRVNAELGGQTIRTDQSVRAGGDGSAPEPFALFLASIGTCAGVYVSGFCQARNISTEGIRITQRMDRNPETGMIESIELDIHVPLEFPQKYYKALVNAANTCAVKKHLLQPPQFSVRTVVDSPKQDIQEQAGL